MSIATLKYKLISSELTAPYTVPIQPLNEHLGLVKNSFLRTEPNFVKLF